MNRPTGPTPRGRRDTRSPTSARWNATGTGPLAGCRVTTAIWDTELLRGPHHEHGSGSSEAGDERREAPAGHDARRAGPRPEEAGGRGGRAARGGPANAVPAGQLARQ